MSALCRFISKPGGCRNGAKCKFNHNVSEVKNWRERADLSPEDIIIEEVNNAVDKNQLNDLFNKMVSSKENYKLYYKYVQRKFYKIAIWKLSNRSINKIIFDQINKDQINTTLPFGYMPLCAHFLWSALSVNMYNEVSSNDHDRKMEECFTEMTDYISGYYNDEYKNVLKKITEYYNPTNDYNIIDILVKYISFKILLVFKIELGDEFDTLLTKKMFII